MTQIYNTPIVLDDLSSARLEALPALVQRSEMELVPIAPQTVELARQFLLLLRETVADTDFAWTAPHFASDGNGDVMLEWWWDNKTLVFFVNPDGTIEYLWAWGPDIEKEMEEGANPESDALKSLWINLHSN